MRFRTKLSKLPNYRRVQQHFVDSLTKQNTKYLLSSTFTFMSDSKISGNVQTISRLLVTASKTFFLSPRFLVYSSCIFVLKFLNLISVCWEIPPWIKKCDEQKLQVLEVSNTKLKVKENPLKWYRRRIFLEISVDKDMSEHVSDAVINYILSARKKKKSIKPKEVNCVQGI